VEAVDGIQRRSRKVARPHTRFGGGPKRQVTWFGPADQAYITVGAGAKVLLSSLDPGTAGLPKPTIVRSRGVVSINPVTAADAQIVGAFGIAIVSDQALAAGIASIPGPLNDSGWDGWFVWRSFAFTQTQLDATGSLIQSIQLEIDSKAMRKVSDNESLVAVAESQAVAFEIYDGVRTLFKLS